MTQFTPCSHSKALKFGNIENCRDCGIYLTKSNSFAMRENDRAFRVDVDLERIHERMHVVQKVNRKFIKEAKHLKFRRILVDWMCEFGEDLKLSNRTIHTAVGYLDTILSSKSIPRQQLQLYAICCILLASKFEEIEDDVPSLRTLYRCSNGAFNVQTIRETEIVLAQLLGWKIKSTTPIHYIDFFLSQGVVFSEDKLENKKLVNDKSVVYVRKYSEFFADLSLQDYELTDYDSRIVATACIAAARRAVTIVNEWNTELEQLTGITEDSFKDCMEVLYRNYEEQFADIVKKNKEKSRSERKEKVKDVASTTPSTDLSEERDDVDELNENEKNQPKNFTEKKAINKENSMESANKVTKNFERMSLSDKKVNPTTTKTLLGKEKSARMENDDSYKNTKKTELKRANTEGEARNRAGSRISIFGVSK
eukprot:CAMPEP_0114991358 /NCGR_PEP_ID=MMETSP0216-20121206/11322_1 /TAXON_ID=223996 /ORGANISM="Protocruzia adherens, Strain Boccale" /LENGTH=423 /DNA_ID=CAMNT_0002354665 /DNA_START=91 /DNA_END=1362 /DNA_ORIENTATION=+